MKESCDQLQAREEQEDVAATHIDQVADRDSHKRNVMKAVFPTDGGVIHSDAHTHSNGQFGRTNVFLDRKPNPIKNSHQHRENMQTQTAGIRLQ